ncbi:hypothetical protein TVAG_193100 [Trichomonas vaginalis G3]|uniref:Uncharacterized protein n=1 Tax=Trichomonas vaginalis (strain ATCC PRA-98 / G3) TaxID=412133 RepID=A2DH24_TRIV3|nr:hypothetical protein TVAGG3_0341500 [Trichomonas vaginalis G3]EAY20334.1 hypothetical protein TVAG_193100 [Trichomonas vaginalis G3]KAI5530676.1 hypothetical protein TVAGG3_0341500 [Trichomonas vaginalis G3]|eukprot:XP_001581320.1 hypothetical protein [Trichomonas vaginalis G3]
MPTPALECLITLFGWSDISKNVANHFWLDLNFEENVANIDADIYINKFWKDNHIAEVCLDNWWMNVCLALNSLTSLLQLLDKMNVLKIE